MKQKDKILQELSELQSSLANVTLENPYSVPAGYFEKLAEKMLNLIRALDADTAVAELESLSSLFNGLNREMPNSIPVGYFENLSELVLRRIRAEEASDAAEEISHLSPLLSSISKEMPYSIPENYFEGFGESVIYSMKEDHESAEDELTTLSPLLSGLKKEMPYSVPAGYFDGVNKTIVAEEKKPKAKVVSLTKQTWFRYAAAAVVTAIFVLSGFLIFKKQNSIDPNNESYAWVKKNLKKVSDSDIEKFAEMVSDGTLAFAEPKADPSEANEIRDLLKDIPDEAIQKFADETEQVVSNDDDADDLFMN